MTRQERLTRFIAAMSGQRMTTTALLDTAGSGRGVERRRAWRDLCAMRAAGELLARREAQDGRPVLVWEAP